MIEHEKCYVVKLEIEARLFGFADLNILTELSRL